MPISTTEHGNEKRKTHKQRELAHLRRGGGLVCATCQVGKKTCKRKRHNTHYSRGVKSRGDRGCINERRCVNKRGREAEGGKSSPRGMKPSGK